MKNTTKILSIILVIALLSACLIACNKPETDVKAESVTLVFVNGETIDSQVVNIADLEMELTQTTTMSDLLAQMKAKQNLAYSESSGFINSIGTLTPNAENQEWICLMSTIEDETVKDISQYGSSAEYNNAKVYSTAVGIGQIPIRDGATYAFVMKKGW